MSKLNCSFKGKYTWLSNFQDFETPMKKIISDMVVHFNNVESFYMAMKTTDNLLRIKIANTRNGSEAKRLGKEVDLREDWDDIKEDVMLYALRYKFSSNNPVLREKLLNTGDSFLQECNWWGDKYWGNLS